MKTWNDIKVALRIRRDKVNRAETTASQMEKENLDSHVSLYTKINFKWNKK